MKLAPPAWNELPIVLWKELDRIVIGLAFIAYGITDLLTPHVRQFPFSYLQGWWDWEFIIAGVLFVVGVIIKSWAVRGVATILYAGGLATIAVAVIFGSGSSSLWLMLAFALQGFADLRRLRVKNEREKTRDVIDASRRARGG